MSLEQNASAAPAVRQTLLSGRDLALDLAERVGVLALFALFVHRMLPRLTSLVLIEMARPELITQAADINAQPLLLVIGEGLGVLLIVLRRSSATLSRHPLDWVLSFGVVSAPLLFTTPAAAGTLVPAATALMLAGLLVQISGWLHAHPYRLPARLSLAAKCPALWRGARRRGGAADARRSDPQPRPGLPRLCRARALPLVAGGVLAPSGDVHGATPAAGQICARSFETETQPAASGLLNKKE